MDTIAKFHFHAQFGEAHKLKLSTDEQFSNSISTGTKNNYKDFSPRSLEAILSSISFSLDTY